LERRGPDASHEIEIDLSTSWKATFSGHTLWLQGDFPVPQPLVDSSGNILLWNGDVFYSRIGDEHIPKGHSDTKFLLDKLENVETVEEICNTLEIIKGPWSLIYYKKSLNRIITGRDRFGRHSLLWNCLNGDGELTCPQLIISSSSQCSTLCEIPASSLYQISFENTISVKNVYSRNPYAINKKPVSDHEFFGWIPDLLDNTSSDQIISDYLNIWQKEVEGLKAALLDSIKSRVHCQPMLCKACVLLHLNGNQIKCTHSKVAILFSGGLDSSVLAALTDRVWPENESIDLLNVAFPLRTKSNPTANKFDVPDRLTGLQALEELQKLNPSRKWNFCKINVELEELLEMRKSRIATLIHPASTVLDDSIGCAQWFATRGRGVLTGCSNNEEYVSPARVVLMGAGADEQMAGYARHRQKFANGGWPLLVSEIEMEMNRISERNLGRDNRILADHGRAPRLPYLDEMVVEYLAHLPIWTKVDLRLPIGLGDKIILRALAFQMGLNKTAIEPKRAIQFGSRIAKTEARKEKGSQICDRLTKSLVLEQ
ncbi:hypothetical protein DAPPUDRAFT_57150, partial [Daphnia pulex]